MQPLGYASRTFACTAKNVSGPCCSSLINAPPCSSAVLGPQKPRRPRNWRHLVRGALESGDRVGAIIFGDEDIVEIKPHRSRTNVLRICHELVRMNGQLSAVAPPKEVHAFNEALRRAANVAVHDFLVVLITDYEGDDDATQGLATRLAAHNDVLAVLVYDPLGIRLPVSGPLEVTDGHQRIQLPPGDRFSERMQAQFQARCDQLRRRLRALRIPILPICTHDPIPEQVRAALGHSSRLQD